mmetsp:Transcript_28393/g.80217  ORF Transcript_28393/g.80217 Transcript_28393/m.80217 type:complete len:384 (+) Transcript_28393:67-1218(+)
MDVLVETDGGQALPADAFVSLRVGEAQRFSRLNASRTYHFPASKDGGPAKPKGRHGHLEVFKRIGAIKINLDAFEGSPDNFVINCRDPELSRLSLRVAVSPVGPEQAGQRRAQEQQQREEALVGARRYIADHRLEELLATTVHELIRCKPDNPHQFLCGQILQATAATQGDQPAGGDKAAEAAPPAKGETPGGDEAAQGADRKKEWETSRRKFRNHLAHHLHSGGLDKGIKAYLARAAKGKPSQAAAGSAPSREAKAAPPGGEAGAAQAPRAGAGEASTQAAQTLLASVYGLSEKVASKRRSCLEEMPAQPAAKGDEESFSQEELRYRMGVALQEASSAGTLEHIVRARTGGAAGSKSEVAPYVEALVVRGLRHALRRQGGAG